MFVKNKNVRNRNRCDLFGYYLAIETYQRAHLLLLDITIHRVTIYRKLDQSNLPS
jgi:hypothetical protein